jgi:hypothetical protein
MTTNWKGFGRNQSWPYFKVLSRHLPGGTEENHQNLDQDSRSPGPRFESGTSQMRRYVKELKQGSFQISHYKYVFLWQDWWVGGTQGMALQS